MAELQADFELLPRQTLEAEYELEPRSEIGATFELHVNSDGRDAKINGVNTLTLNAEDGIVLTQVEDVATLSAPGLVQAITDEAIARENADTVLDGRIDAVAGNLAQEVLDRQSADNTLQGNIDAEETARKAADKDLQDAIDTKQPIINDLDTIRSNAQAGKQASDTIATYGDIVTHDVDEFATAAQGTLADTALQPGDNVSELVNDSGYLTGITSLMVTTALGYTPYDATNPNGYISGITSSDVTSALGYTPYDATNPNGYISGITSSDVTSALGYTPYDATNPNNYQTGTQVSNAVGVETTNRENADIALQQQIDAITASSDVKDIVGTYAELQQYDTSTLGNNDIIKVLQDETQNGATTYYRWNTTTQTFTLIGQEGPYYTKSEADSEFVPQTRTVNGKALSADITLTNADIGSQPAGNYVTTDTAQDITATKTFKAPQKFQSGDAAGCITIGADVSSTTVSSNTRKLGRMCFYTNEDPSLKCSFVSTDSQDIGGNVINFVEFGGRSGDQLNTSPDTIQFTVANSHNSTTSKTTVAEYTASGSQFNSNNLAVITANRTSNSGGSFIKYARKGTSLGHLGIAGTGVPAFSDASAVNNNVLVRCGATTAPEVGSTTQPVYIDSNGIAQAITDMATTDTAQTITGDKTFTEPVTIQNGQGTGCLLVGANVNSSTLSNNQRKLARINAPSYANKDLGATLIGWDTSGDSDSPVTNKSYDSVCFGGMKKITNCTSPMSITFCVTDTRAATAAANKKYALAMDANEAIFGVQPKYNGNNLATVNDIVTSLGGLTDVTVTTPTSGQVLSYDGSKWVNSSTGAGVTDVEVNGTSVVSGGVASVSVPTQASDINALPDSTKYGADLDLTGGTLQLLDQDGNALGNSVTVPDTSDFVQKTGDTMTGALNIDAQTDDHLKLVHSDTTKGTNPATTEYTVIEFNDNTNDDDYTQTRLGDVHHTLMADGKSMMTISAYKNELGSADNANLQISDDTSANKLVQTNCNVAVGSDNNRMIQLYNPDLTKGTAPASDTYMSIEFNDKTNSSTVVNTRLGVLELKVGSDGATRMQLGAVRNSAGVGTNSLLKLDMSSAGVASCEFPNTTRVDGQWVHSASNLESQVSYAVGTYSKNFDLSSYLPNDGKKYEVLVSAETSTGSSSGSYVYVRVQSDIITSDVTLLRAVTRTSSSATAGGSVIIPVGTGRKLVRSVQVGTSATGNSYLWVYGYRRIGDNS